MVLMSIIIIVLIYFLYFLNNKRNILENSTKNLKEYVSKLEEERTRLLNVCEYQKRELEKFKPVIDLEKIKTEIRKMENYFEELKEKVELFEKEETIIDCGLYKPEYSFENSEAFKNELSKIREQQKLMLKEGKAVKNNKKGNISTEEKKQIESYHKLMLRAFNGESDVIISNIKWNNVDKGIDKINSIFEAINKIAEKNQSRLLHAYKDLKLKELKLKYEYEKKLNDEKEEQRIIKERIREEEKALREMEKAQKDAEKEEERYQKALDEAKKELLNAHGEELDKINENMRILEQELAEAKERRERAMSMAQQTKVGHVYIISNIGSFGEDVYKIGMTRRLEPLDRVKELGDASVPFEFDVHGLIFSENAPELENLLHKEFDNKRVNMINNRKEFFNVSINEIENIVRKYNSEVELTKLAEARQYRESVMIRNTLFENIVNTDDSIQLNN